MSLPNIMIQFSDEENLARGLILTEKRPSNATCVKEYLGMLSCGDNPTPAGKAASFVSFTSSKVQVEFDIIGRRLRRYVLESVTREKHGSEGVRILRLLMDMGKMDDKQVRTLTGPRQGGRLTNTTDIQNCNDGWQRRSFSTDGPCCRFVH
jgi:DNA-directed RNA polymerase III subunit RPC3